MNVRVVLIEEVIVSGFFVLLEPFILFVPLGVDFEFIEVLLFKLLDGNFALEENKGAQRYFF